MNDVYLWSAILLVTLATLVTRSSLHLLGERLRLPASVESALRFDPLVRSPRSPHRTSPTPKTRSTCHSTTPA